MEYDIIDRMINNLRLGMYNILVSDIWLVSTDDSELFQLASIGTALLVGLDYILLTHVEIDVSNAIVFSVMIRVLNWGRLPTYRRARVIA